MSAFSRTDIVAVYRAIVPGGIIGKPVPGRSQTEVLALCPFHADTDPSLRLNTEKAAYYCDSCGACGDAGTLVKKLKNCSDRDMFEWFREHRFAFDDSAQTSHRIKPGNGHAAKPTPCDGEHVGASATFEYRDADGALRYVAIRYDRPDGKSFALHAVHDGECSASLNGSTRIPYRLTPLREGIEDGRTVLVTEGEKKADTLGADGFCATTSAGGASYKWPIEWRQFFAGCKKSIILTDSDAPGRKAADERAQWLLAAGVPDVRICDLYPDKTDGSDVLDWLFDHDRAELESRLKAAKRVSAQVQPVGNDPAGMRLLIRSFEDIQEEEIAWLWTGRVALGKVALFVGDPEAGKSYATHVLAATVSRGKPLPGDENALIPPSDVLIASYEDNAADTIKKRLRLNGADQKRVHSLDGLGQKIEDSPDRLFNAATDVRYLEAALEQNPDVRLIIIDPLVASLSNINTHRDADTRAALAPLVKLAERRHIALVCVMHLNKSAIRVAYRVSGSGAFFALARTVSLFEWPDKSTDRRILANFKCNIAKPPGSIEYRIDDEGVFRWGELSDITAMELLTPEATEGGSLSKIDEAVRFLRELMANGDILTREADKACNGAGYSAMTIRRAKDRLGIVSWRPDAKNRGPWFWKMPVSNVKEGT